MRDTRLPSTVSNTFNSRSTKSLARVLSGHLRALNRTYGICSISDILYMTPENRQAFFRKLEEIYGNTQRYSNMSQAPTRKLRSEALSMRSIKDLKASGVYSESFIEELFDPKKLEAYLLYVLNPEINQQSSKLSKYKVSQRHLIFQEFIDNGYNIWNLFNKDPMYVDGFTYLAEYYYGQEITVFQQENVGCAITDAFNHKSRFRFHYFILNDKHLAPKSPAYQYVHPLPMFALNHNRKSGEDYKIFVNHARENFEELVRILEDVSVTIDFSEKDRIEEFLKLVFEERFNYQSTKTKTPFEQSFDKDYKPFIENKTYNFGEDSFQWLVAVLSSLLYGYELGVYKPGNKVLRSIDGTNSIKFARALQPRAKNTKEFMDYFIVSAKKVFN